MPENEPGRRSGPANRARPTLAAAPVGSPSHETFDRARFAPEPDAVWLSLGDERFDELWLSLTDEQRDGLRASLSGENQDATELYLAPLFAMDDSSEFRQWVEAHGVDFQRGGTYHLPGMDGPLEVANAGRRRRGQRQAVKLLRKHGLRVPPRRLRHGCRGPSRRDCPSAGRRAERRPRARSRRLTRSPRRTRGPDDRDDGDPEPPARRLSGAGGRVGSTAR